jgi:hypothetical protein
MANTDDSSGKGPTKPAPETASRKPTALIDLKATEVDIRDPKQAAKTDPTKPAEAAAALAGAAKVADAAAKSAASATAAGAGAASTAANAATQTKPAASATPASGAGGAPASATSSSTSSSRASSPAAHLPPPPAPTGGGLRSAATHLVAGLAGGLIALLGADRLAPHLGLVGTSAQVSPDIAKRLSALESSATRSVPGDIAQKLAAAEARLIEVDRTGRTVAALVQQQAKLEAEAKALSDRLAAAPPSAGADIGDAVARIARLEEILGTISAAAKDPQAGRVPQLAAIAGRLADLESSVAAQVAALRKSVTQEVDSRLGQSAEAAEAARTGTQRLDRELAGVKTEAAQLSQRLDALKSQADRADVAVRGLRDESSALKAVVAAANDELKSVARPTDVATALSPLSSKLSALEQNVQGVVRSEDDRRANVERIVTALELGNLKRTIDRGAAFEKELAEVRRVAGPKLDLSVLERYRAKGVPAVAELERDFRKLAFAVIEADQRPADAHWTDRLLSSAKSIVRVRRTEQGEAQGAEAIVARMEAGLKASRLMDVVAEAAKLSQPAKAAAAPWLEQVEARLAVDRAIAAIEQELKSSLSATSPAGKRG